jgi:predicted RNA binding protein YcfA (HicA-like mRNA interferase family)
MDYSNLALALASEGSRIPFSMLIVFGCAKVSAEIAERLKQPGIVGEIVAGVLIGPSVLGWIEPSDLLKTLADLGFKLVATRGTAAALRAAGLTSKTILKVNEGRPNAVDMMKAGTIQLVIYTAAGAHSFSDERAIRRTAVAYRVPCITTMSGAKAAAEAVASRRRDPIRVWSLQEIHEAARQKIPV